MTDAEFMCFACGYPALLDRPRFRTGGASFEICSSCGFEEGVEDDDLVISYSEWRDRWRAAGCARYSDSGERPAGWSPMEQLKRLQATLQELRTWRTGSSIEIDVERDGTVTARIEAVEPRDLWLDLRLPPDIRDGARRPRIVRTLDTFLLHGVWRVLPAPSSEDLPASGPVDDRRDEVLPAIAVNALLRDEPGAPATD